LDRPNLSKDFLAGSAPAEGIPQRTADYYQATQIHFVTGSSAGRIHPDENKVTLRVGVIRAAHA
jgi:NADPH-dependent 2,4-dienoyl-CoA reductase/sulfur reductase-like enzyme